MEEKEEAHGLGFDKARSNESVLPVCGEAAADSHCWSFPWEGPVPTKLTDTLDSSLNKVV